MDIDHIFVGIHIRVIRLLAIWLSRPIRLIILLLSFISAAAVILLLIWFHIQHVHISPRHQSFLSPAPAICAPELVSVLGQNPHNRIIEIVIQGPQWLEQIKNNKNSNENSNQLINDENNEIAALSAEQLHRRVEFEISDLGNVEKIEDSNNNAVKESIPIQPKKQAATPPPVELHPDSVIYQYSRERGYFLLSKRALSHHRLDFVQFLLPFDHLCFGPAPLARFTYRFIGYDTIMLNQLINIFGYRGFVRNKKTFDLYPLNAYNEETEHLLLPTNSTHFDSASASSPYVFSPTHSPNHWIENHYSILDWAEFFLFKFGLFMTVTFLFFAISTLVSLTLTQTQIRMLIFTDALRSSLRIQAPIIGLVLEHLVQSLAFVPVVIGMLFFLFEFFGDQILSFLLLILVWLCESFTVIFVRVDISMRYFPKLFAIYFMCFGLYFFNFPYGFHYLAILSTYMLLQFFMCFYLFIYEFPAVLSGEISTHRPRMLILKRRGNAIQMRNMSQVEVNNGLLNGITSSSAFTIEHDRLRMQQQTERLMRLMMSMNLQVQQHQQIQQALQNQNSNNFTASNNSNNSSNPNEVRNDSRESNASPIVVDEVHSPTSPPLNSAAVGSTTDSLPPLFPASGAIAVQSLSALRQLPELLSSMIRNAQALRTMSVQQQQQLRAQLAQISQTNNTANPQPQQQQQTQSQSQSQANNSQNPQHTQAQLNHLRTHIFEQLAHALQVSLYVLNTLVYGANSGVTDPQSPALPLLQSIRSLQTQLGQAQLLYNQSIASHHRRGSRTIQLNSFPIGFGFSNASAHSSGSNSSATSNAGSPLLGPLSAPRSVSTPSTRVHHSNNSTPVREPASFDDYLSMEDDDPMEGFDLDAIPINSNQSDSKE